MRRCLLLAAVFFAIASPASAVSMFGTTLSENTTTSADSAFTGAPDDTVGGLALNHVIYDFGALRVSDVPGVDINVYELDAFTAEFNVLDVLVSAAGGSFVSIKSTETALVRILGDSSQGTANARSYDLAGSGVASARFVKLQGTGTNGTTGTLRVGFDLDAIGVHDAIPATTPVPEPSTLALLGTGVLGALLLRRRA